jgi:hypothetical protein
LIGLGAILQDLIPCVVLGFFGLVIWLIVGSGEKWWKQWVAWLFLAVFLFLGYSYVTGIVAGLRGFHFLRTLQSDSVESISVDNVAVSDEPTKAVLVSALRHVRWFSSSHGGWAREVPLRIRLKNGREQEFTTALYLRQRGVVIRGTFRTRWSHGAYDCGFSGELPDVLAASKIPLPSSQ